jgi:catechol 2,3-dioxygenase-like lactoylglutathione lyase family enzyme
MLSNFDVMAFAATKQPERAKAFYRDVLGLRLVEEDPFALVFDAHGTMLRISSVNELTPATYTVLGWNVPDLRAAIGGLSSRGVAFERYQGMPQDERGIWTSPGGHQIAWFKDPDGNTLSLTQFISP